MSRLKLPQIKMMMTLLGGFCFYQGRANMTNLARFVDESLSTVWRWSRRQFDYAEFNLLLIAKMAGYSDHQFVAAVDASFIRKSGKHTYGVSRFYNGCASRVEKGLEISCIAAIDRTLNTAFALEAIQSKVPPKQSKVPTKKDKADKSEKESNSITHLLEALQGHKNSFKGLGIDTLVADGWYAKKSFIDGLQSQDLHLVCKLRVDANIRYVNTAPYSGRGRPRTYGDKIDLFTLTDFDKVEIDTHLVGFSKVVYAVAFKRFIHVVVIRSKDDLERNLAILFSTNVDESAAEIVSIYQSRFQIEFLFRDAKQHCGLEDCQARNEQALYNHFNNSLTAVNLLKFEELNMGKAQEQQVISIASARRRKTNLHVAESIFSRLDQELSCDKIGEIMEYIDKISDIAA